MFKRMDYTINGKKPEEWIAEKTPQPLPKSSGGDVESLAERRRGHSTTLRAKDVEITFHPSTDDENTDE